MRKFFSCLTVLFLLGLIGFFIWSQRGAVFDFFGEVQRRAEAPAAVTFEEVAGVEEVEGSEGGEGGEGVGGANSSSLPVTTPSTIPPSTTLPPSTASPPSSIIPSEFNLAVPFTSQTPYANWDAVHEETCEEAALYMVHEFYQGTPDGQIAADVAETDIMKIVEFEKALFGFFESTTATQIAVLAEQMYGYEKVEVVTDPTIEDLKRYLVAGYPVIVPSAGHLLGNPNFSGDGPLYHALVLKGYTETTFVTNDPGTRRGADYQYDFETVMTAMHDWNEGDVLNGAKVVVVVYPNKK